MNPEEQQQISGGNWGMPRGLYYKAKYYGIPIMKAFILAGSFVVPLQLRDLFFPPDQEAKFLLTTACSVILTIYWMLPSPAGGSNLWAFIHAHRRTKRRYYSIDKNCYPELVDDGSRDRRQMLAKATEKAKKGGR